MELVHYNKSSQLTDFKEHVSRVRSQINYWPQWKKDLARLISAHDSYGEPNIKMLKRGDCSCSKCKKVFG